MNMDPFLEGYEREALGLYYRAQSLHSCARYET